VGFAATDQTIMWSLCRYWSDK